MEKDTVCISTKEYNELRDFKKDMEENHSLIIVRDYAYYSKRIITADKAVEDLAERVKALHEKLNTVNEEWIKRIQNRTETIRKLSVRQFRKWRKDPNNRYITHEK
ncbi:MAG: hypothetical protein PHW73_00010 [Atribacterota bacterium]|nr:hypothetical protein [Atribacterota bacterium]